MQRDPVDVVADVYAAYAAGDTAAILAVLADDVLWERWVGEVPYLQEQRDAAEVRHFFAHGGPRDVTAGTPKPAEPGTVRVAVTVAGEPELHAWYVALDGPDAGKVHLIRHYVGAAETASRPAGTLGSRG